MKKASSFFIGFARGWMGLLFFDFLVSRERYSDGGEEKLLIFDFGV